MKKILAALLVLVMAIGIGSIAMAEEWSYDTPMKVGFSQNKLSVAFRVAGVDQLKAYVAEKGLNW